MPNKCVEQDWPTYDTARTDLLRLVELGLLEKSKIGKAFAFTATRDLKRAIEGLK